MIERRAYLDALWRWKDKQVIKVITGIRRCGKSTLMALYQQELVERGVAREQILSVNLEDYANYALRDPHKLHAHVLAQAEKVQGKLYVCLLYTSAPSLKLQRMTAIFPQSRKTRIKTHKDMKTAPHFTVRGCCHSSSFAFLAR